MTYSLQEPTCRNQHIFSEIVRNYLELGWPACPSFIFGTSLNWSVMGVCAHHDGKTRTDRLSIVTPFISWPFTNLSRVALVCGWLDGSWWRAKKRQTCVHGWASSGYIGWVFNSCSRRQSMTLTGLSKRAFLAFAPTKNLNIIHIEFVPLLDKRMLIINFSSGQAENRMIGFPDGLSASSKTEASNCINAVEDAK